MPIRVTCPSCGRSGRVPDQAAGKNVVCPACAHRYKLPAASVATSNGLDELELLDDEPAPRPKAEPDFRPAPKVVKPSRPSALPEAVPWNVRQAETSAAGGLNWVLLAGLAGAATVVLLIVGVIYEATRDRGGRQLAASGTVTVQETGVAQEVGFVAEARAAAAAPSGPDGANRVLTTAEIIAESDASIALIRGKSSSGTGFLVGPGLLATNSHVIDGEFLGKLQVHFPAADARHKGPLTAELLYEDPARDLAFLAVPTNLPPLRIAQAYKFKKGEDITVIGSPGIGEGKVLENAVSRGVMSTRAELNGKSFYQLGIAVNPGNSGGPVFDSSGRVIGVVTLKTAEQEALAFCVPLEDLRAALTTLAAQTPADSARLRSRHRAVHAVEGLGVAGAVYVAAIGGVAAKNAGRLSAEESAKVEKLQSALPELESALFGDIVGQLPAIRDDNLLPENVRSGVAGLADNYQKLRAIQSRPHARVRLDELRPLMESHKRLIVELSQALDLEPPTSMLTVFDLPKNAGNDAAVAVAPPAFPPGMPGSGNARIDEFRRRMHERRLAPPIGPRSRFHGGRPGPPF